MKDNVLLRTENMSRKYVISDRRETEIEVLKDINLEIREQEFISIMGKSGSGKTTLLKLLGLIDRPTSGKLYFKGVDSEELRGDRLARIRRQDMGFVYQDYYLLDSLSVFENIMLPMILDHKDDKVCKEEAEKLAVSFQIQNLLGKYPYELSGGEKQRTAICRALVNQPDVIFADEPTGNLDSRSTEIVMDVFSKIHSKMHKTVIMVTHDINVGTMTDQHVPHATITEDGTHLTIVDAASHTTRLALDIDTLIVERGILRLDIPKKQPKPQVEEKKCISIEG